LGALGQAYALDGKPAEARAMLARLVEKAKHSYVPSNTMALVHTALGETDRALDLLELACERRDLPLSAIKVHPAYDALRKEPRFAALLKRIGLGA
jgi:hypothetical protein